MACCRIEFISKWPTGSFWTRKVRGRGEKKVLSKHKERAVIYDLLINRHDLVLQAVQRSGGIGCVQTAPPYLHAKRPHKQITIVENVQLQKAASKQQGTL